MAIRRAKQKEQVIAKLKELAPPGEEFLACVHCESGPSPWLGILFDEIPLVGLIVALLRKYYFITLTSSHLVINSANRFSNRPGDVVVAYPRESLPLSRIKRVRLWSSLYIQLPGGTKPTRINIDRYWRTELDQLIANLPADMVHNAEAAGEAA